MCYSCVSALVVPIFCTVQTVLRVIMTLVLAVEDLLRLIIQAVHSWVSTVLHAVAVIPLCLVFCFTQKCFCSQICSTSCSPGCYPMRSNCGCILFLTMTLVFILVYLFTDWWEELFATLGLEIPCFFEKKAEVSKPQAAYKNKSESMTVKSANRRDQRPQESVHSSLADKRHTTKSIKQFKKPTRHIHEHEMQNELDVSYIEHFKETKKENTTKFRSDERNVTYVTVVVNAILEEPDEESLRKK